MKWSFLFLLELLLLSNLVCAEDIAIETTVAVETTTQIATIVPPTNEYILLPLLSFVFGVD